MSDVGREGKKQAAPVEQTRGRVSHTYWLSVFAFGFAGVAGGLAPCLSECFS